MKNASRRFFAAMIKIIEVRCYKNFILIIKISLFITIWNIFFMAQPEVEAGEQICKTLTDRQFYGIIISNTSITEEYYALLSALFMV